VLFFGQSEDNKICKEFEKGTGHGARGTGHRARGTGGRTARGMRHAAKDEERGRQGDLGTKRPQDCKTTRPQDQKRPSRDGLFYRNYLILIFFSGFGLASSFFGMFILRMPLSYFASILSLSADSGSVNDLQNDW